MNAAAIFLPAQQRRAIDAVLDDVARGDTALYCELLARLLEANANDLTRLTDAARAHDWPTVRACAHRIKGSGGLARCQPLVATAHALEDAARSYHSVAVTTSMPHFLAVANEFNEVLRLLLEAARLTQSEHSIHGMDVQCIARTGTLSACTGKTG
ncbi:MULTISPECIES: Hpt domain-containing protein [unclassified Cupriavidus]|uniref:Hpt domain-containing protein n=1 Tax=Cupriavidus sp. H19C3 TaxID=3241603 RepID=UPI003BF89CBB